MNENEMNGSNQSFDPTGQTLDYDNQYGMAGQNAGQSSQYGMPGQNAGQGSQYGMPGQNAGQSSQYGMAGQNAGQGSQYGMPGQNVGQSSQYGMAGQNADQGSQYGMPGQNAGQSSQYGMAGQSAGQGSQYGMPGQNAGQSSQYGMPGQSAGQGSQYGMPGQNAGQSSQYEMPGQNNLYGTNEQNTTYGAMQQDNSMDMTGGSSSVGGAGGVNPELQQPKKKSKVGKIIAGAACAVAAVGIAGGTAYAFVPSVNNAVMKTVLSPEKYYLYVEKNALEGVAESISDSYENSISMLKGVDKDTARKMYYKIDVDDSIKGQIGLNDYLPAQISVDSYMKKGLAQQKTIEELSLGDDKIGTAEVLQSTGKDNTEIFVRIPEFNSTFLKIALENSGDEELTTVMDAFREYMNNPTSAELVSDVIERYGMEFFENASDVKMESGAAYQVDGVKDTATKLSVKITAEDFYEAYVSILDKAKTDDDLIKEMERLGACTKKDYQEAIDEALEEVKDAKETEGLSGAVNMDVYVDGDGDVLGRDFVIEGEDATLSLSYRTVSKDGETHVEGNIASDDEKYVTLTGSYKESEKGLSGDYHFEVPGADGSADLTFKDIRVADNGYNMLLGEAKVTSDAMGDGAITFAGKEEGGLVIGTIGVENEGTQMGYLEVGCGEMEYKDFDMPSDKDAIEISEDNSEALMEYMQGADQDYIQKLSDKFAPLASQLDALSFLVSNSDLLSSSSSDIMGNLFGMGDASDDDTYDSDDSQSSILNSFGNSSSDSEFENTGSNSSSINLHPETKDDVPDSAKWDGDSYSYTLTDEEVAENNVSTPNTFDVVYDDVDWNKLFKIRKAKTWKETMSDSYNYVGGDLGEDAYVNCTTTAFWEVGNGMKEYATVKYDTLTKKIQGITVSTKKSKNDEQYIKAALKAVGYEISKDDMEKILTDLKKKGSAYIEHLNVCSSTYADGDKYISIEHSEF